jgi:hypothetical protein
VKDGACPGCEAPTVYRKRGIKAYIADEEKLLNVGRT